MILSKLSGMAGHGSFPMKVVGLLQNNLVRTNHTGFYYVSTRLYIFISVMNLDVMIVMNCNEFGWLRSSFFVAAFSNTSSRENPSGAFWFVFSLHFLPSFLFDIECLPRYCLSSAFIPRPQRKTRKQKVLLR